MSEEKIKCPECGARLRALEKQRADKAAMAHVSPKDLEALLDAARTLLWFSRTGNPRHLKVDEAYLEGVVIRLEVSQ